MKHPSRMNARHRGYRVRHERAVNVGADDVWRIRDDLSARPQTYRLHWLLADWQWSFIPGSRNCLSRPGLVSVLAKPIRTLDLPAQVSSSGAGSSFTEIVRSSLKLGASRRDTSLRPLRGARLAASSGVVFYDLRFPHEVRAALIVRRLDRRD
jgi:hypothetical protein